MSFVVAPLDAAWNYLSKLEEWPRTWAGHLKRVTCYPPGRSDRKDAGHAANEGGFLVSDDNGRVPPRPELEVDRERAAIPPWLSITSSKL